MEGRFRASGRPFNMEHSGRDMRRFGGATTNNPWSKQKNHTLQPSNEGEAIGKAMKSLALCFFSRFRGSGGE